eukprot:14802209-Alexandrium_andersonii.AAC.1
MCCCPSAVAEPEWTRLGHSAVSVNSLSPRRATLGCVGAPEARRREQVIGAILHTPATHAQL